MESDVRKKFLIAVAAGTALLGARMLFSRQRPFTVTGKVVLVTGGTRGLGLVLARELANQGAKVAICGREDETLNEARRDLLTVSPDVLAETCDVTKPADVEKLVSAVISRFGRVDALINNAAILSVGPMDAMTLQDFEEALQVSFWAPLHCVLAVLPHFREAGEGRIVNISSIGGKIAVPHMLPYSAAKFALSGLSRGLRSELAKDGIVVTTVYPGLMRTGSPVNVTFKGKHSAEYAWFAISDSLPLTSMPAEQAAIEIVEAMVRGDAEVILSLQARSAVLVDALLPELSAEVLAMMNRFLPAASGRSDGMRGVEAAGDLRGSSWTAASDEAATNNNQMEAAQPARS